MAEVNFTQDEVAYFPAGGCYHCALASNYVGNASNSACALICASNSACALNCASAVDCAVPQGQQCQQSYFTLLQGNKTVSSKY